MRVDGEELETVIQEDDGSGAKGSGDLDDRVGQNLFPREAAVDGEGERDSRVEMRTGGFSGDIDSHGDGQSPGQRDIGVAAFIKEDIHGDDAVAEQDEDHGAEEFGYKLCGEPVVHRYR